MTNSNQKRTIYLIVLACSILISNAVSASMATHRKGIDIGARAGVNQCIKDNDATCENIMPGGGMGLLAGVRFLPYLSIDMDFGFYFFGYEDIETTYLTDLIFELRAYIPLNRVDIYGKFGWGFMALGAEDGDERIVVSSWANLKWGGGATFFFLQKHRLGDMGIGFDVDYLWTNYKKIKICEENDCETWDIDEMIENPETGSGADAIQYSVHWLWVFPVFGS